MNDLLLCTVCERLESIANKLDRIAFAMEYAQQNPESVQNRTVLALSDLENIRDNLQTLAGAVKQVPNSTSVLRIGGCVGEDYSYSNPWGAI